MSEVCVCGLRSPILSLLDNSRAFRQCGRTAMRFDRGLLFIILGLLFLVACILMSAFFIIPHSVVAEACVGIFVTLPPSQGRYVFVQYHVWNGNAHLSYTLMFGRRCSKPFFDLSPLPDSRNRISLSPRNKRGLPPIQYIQSTNQLTNGQF